MVQQAIKGSRVLYKSRRWFRNHLQVMLEIYVLLYKKFKACDIQGAMQMQTKANKVIKVLLDWS